MIKPPDTNFPARVVNFPVGHNDIGVQIRDADGNVVLARTTVGVLENPAASGSYIKILTSPSNPGDYSILWDVANVITSYEELTVSGGYVSSEVLPGQILANLDDINANLPSDADSPVVIATTDNTNLLQISVARVIRGYLSRIIDNGILLDWNIPTNTPEIIREVAGKLIASQLYFNETGKSSAIVDKDSWSQIKYNEAMEILRQIVVGDILIVGISTDATGDMSEEDFWPIDSTDRAFTMGQIF